MPEIKKRKGNFTPIFSLDILFHISQFILQIKDYFSLYSCCKYFFEDFLKNNNNSLNEIFKRNDIYSINNMPIYISNKLKYLNLKTDKMSNLNFNNFVNLEELTLQSKNQMTNLNLNEKCLQNLINLKKLNISNCRRFTGEYLKNFTKLTYLNACGTNLEEKYLETLQNLEHLKIIGCFKLSGKVLKNLKNLKSLDIFDFDLNYLFELINLEKLFIICCNLENVNFPTSLKYLEIEDCKVTDNHLQNLQNLNHLQLINVEEGNFTGISLQNLKKLQYLKIDDVKDFNFEFLKDLKQLKKLKLINCENLKGIHLQNLKNNLESLTVKNNVNIKDEDLQSFVNLTKFTFFNCKNIKGSCLQYFTKLKLLKTDLTLTEKYPFKIYTIE